VSTTETDVSIDLDALDAAKNAPLPGSDADKAAKTAKATPKDDIEVVREEPAAKAPKADVLTPDAGLEKLKAQLEAERTARQAAERHAAEASQSEVQARTEVQTSQLDITKTAIDTMKQSQKSLRGEYAAAMQAQDFEKVAEIQEQMSDTSAKLLYLENSKAALEKAPKPQPRAPVDQVEAFASRLTPQSAAWVREHPEYVRDPAKNRKMLAAHEMVLADGIKPDTPEYFRGIEETLRMTPRAEVSRVDDDPMADAAREVVVPEPRRAAPTAAPVSRSGNGTGKRSNVVTLSAMEVEMAESMSMTPEEYARNKLALVREGKLGKPN
jgi:hypothetical protein